MVSELLFYMHGHTHAEITHLSYFLATNHVTLLSLLKGKRGHGPIRFNANIGSYVLSRRYEQSTKKGTVGAFFFCFSFTDHLESYAGGEGR